MTYVFKNKYITNIFVKGMWFHIFGTWKVKSNTYTIDLNLKFTCLTTNPPPPFYKWISPGTVGGGGWVGPPPPPPPTWILYPPLPIKTPIRWFFLSRCKEQFDMTCLGTIQANRKGLPKDFTAVNNRPVGDYQVLYDEASHVSIHSEIFKNKSGKGISSFFRVFEKPLCSCDDGYFSFEKQRLPFWIL